MSKSPTLSVLSIVCSLTTTVFVLRFQFEYATRSGGNAVIPAGVGEDLLTILLMVAGFPVAFILALIASVREERWSPMATAVVALGICFFAWARAHRDPPEPRLARVVELPLYAEGFSALTDGRLLLWNTYQFALLSPDGSYAEGALGPSRLDPFTPQTAIGPDGSVFKMGVDTVVRFTAAGRIDPSFRYDGKLPPSWDISERRMAAGPDGSLFVSHPLARLKPDGSMDNEFRPPDRESGYKMEVIHLLPLLGSRLAVTYGRLERTDLDSWVSTQTFIDVLDPTGRREGTLHLPGILEAAAVNPSGDVMYLYLTVPEPLAQDLVQVSLRNRPQVLRRRRIAAKQEPGPFDLAVAKDGKVLLRMESQLRRYTANLVEDKDAVRWTRPPDQALSPHGLAVQDDRILILNGGFVARLLPNGEVDRSFRLPMEPTLIHKFRGEDSSKH